MHQDVYLLVVTLCVSADTLQDTLIQCIQKAQLFFIGVKAKERERGEEIIEMLLLFNNAAKCAMLPSSTAVFWVRSDWQCVCTVVHLGRGARSLTIHYLGPF